MLMLVLLAQSLVEDMSVERLVRGITDRMVDTFIQYANCLNILLL